MDKLRNILNTLTLKDVVVARMGGDEFAVLAHGSREEITDKVSRMKSAAAKHKGERINEVYLSVGVACRSEYEDLTPEGLYQKADKFMYEDKSAYYRAKGKDRRRR